MPDRISWRAANAEWKKEDDAFKAKYGHEYWVLFRHQLMPSQLSGRVVRMLKRIQSNARLVMSMEAHAGVEWLPQNSRLRRARWQLADSIRTLRRHIRRPVDHPKGGLQGMTEEFSPMLRAYLKGKMDNVTFMNRMEWALRMVEHAANPRTGHEHGTVKIQRGEDG